MATTHLDVQALTIAVGFVIPLLTSIVTKEKAPAWVKAVVNALLGAIAGALVTAIGDNGNVVLGSWVTGIAEAFITSVASYFGLWKPSGVADAISLKTAALGLGKKNPSKLTIASYDSQLWESLSEAEVYHVLPSDISSSPAPSVKAPEKKVPARKTTSGEKAGQAPSSSSTAAKRTAAAKAKAPVKKAAARNA